MSHIKNLLDYLYDNKHHVEDNIKKLKQELKEDRSADSADVEIAVINAKVEIMQSHVTIINHIITRVVEPFEQ